MLKADLPRAAQAVEYLADTAGFDVNNVTGFVIIAKLPQVGQSRPPAVSVVIDPNDQAFAAIKTRFGTMVSNKQQAATDLLTQLNVT